MSSCWTTWRGSDRERGPGGGEFPRRLRLAEPGEIDAAYRSFLIYQTREFGRALERHYACRMLDLDGLIVYAGCRRLVGTTRVIVGAPEAFGPPEAWLEKIARLRPGSLEVLTDVPLPAHEAYRVSAADNYSFVIDLRQGEQAIWKRMDKRCRESVRRAGRLGLSGRPAETDAELDAFYAELVATSRGGTVFEIPPRALLADLVASGVGKLFVGVREGRALGGLLFLLHAGRHMLAWVGAFDHSGAQGLGSHVVHWEALRWGAAHGFSVYDMGPQSLSAHAGLTLFKGSFSPVLVPAYRYEVPVSPCKRALLAACRWLGRRRTA